VEPRTRYKKEKSMRLCLKKVIFPTFIIGLFFNFAVNAEYAHYGDYTTSGPAVFDGDLIIIGGNLDLKHTFSVNGDLKVANGKIVVLSDNGSTTTVALSVKGDLIVTNSNYSGAMDASINVPTGSIDVSGEIFSHSKKASAFINGRYGIVASSIEASAKVDAQITATGGSIVSSGPISTRSETSTAYVWAGTDIKAGSVSTSSSGLTIADHAYVRAERSLEVVGEIRASASGGSGNIMACETYPGHLEAGSITSKASVNARIVLDERGYVAVENDILLESATDSADIYIRNNSVIESNNGYLKAHDVKTKGRFDASIDVRNNIDVRGDIRTYCTAGDGYVRSLNGFLKAKSISTFGYAFAYVSAEYDIIVKELLSARDSYDVGGEAYVRSDLGNIKAGSINADAYLGNVPIVATQGSIDVVGSINLLGNQSYIYALNDIYAENIYTSGDEFSYVRSVNGDIVVKDAINLKDAQSDGDAYVWAEHDISAGSIVTDSGDEAYVKSTSGSINVKTDLFTKSATGDAYVSATSGNVVAQRIKTEAPDTKDRSIQAAAGSGSFMLKLDEDVSSQTLTLSNCEFDLDTDYDLDIVLALSGTCTLNGKGHQLKFMSNGRILVNAGSEVSLNNISLHNLGGTAISCADTAGKIWLDSVKWTQTADSTFSNGSLEIVGDTIISGPSTQFIYNSSQASTIHSRSELALDYTTTLVYSSAGSGNIAMTDASSCLHFISSDLSATEDVRFTNGTLVFDHKVNFDVAAAKTVYFGNGVEANNINLDYRTAAQLFKLGSGAFSNQNV